MSFELDPATEAGLKSVRFKVTETKIICTRTINMVPV